MKAFALIALTCVVLAACGGDDSPSAAAPAGSGSGSGNSGGTGGGTGNGGGTSGGTGGGTGGTGGSGGGAVTLRYEALPTASDAASFLTLVNGEGAKGYRYLSDAYYAADAATRSIFVNDGAAQTYTYQLQSPPADVAAFVAQANAQGASGYRYEGPLTYGELYRKDGGSSATYTYAAANPPTDTAAFIAQANDQGQSGYWFVGPMMIGSQQANLYMKNNASAATYIKLTGNMIENATSGQIIEKCATWDKAGAASSSLQNPLHSSPVSTDGGRFTMFSG
ncbi:DUF2345 domain-containing protein [Burkholderia multivorans]|uniref:DUF2345 domain-containing protein n=1 Tax=Burkholderia multivorans TaxID=87883 RepID=UPI00201A121B|nr:DUF2345 domain-containing protein [Burkholderia multivorans]MCO1385912.1 DUF2345 domain-containing protein [Burkholderia multivorans]MCO1404255.1 DUF2345 domain-containing protein [Burkholderia multivorans]UQO81737.1 DUF2345 domain-containing protein [Burkholderia multivorans]